MQEDSQASQAICAFDVVKAIAFIGDLSMGQPTDHSLRAAWLAARIAHCAGLDVPACESVREAALLRWSGCTANAREFSEMLGDDVVGREAMLARRQSWTDMLDTQDGAGIALIPLAQIHCDVSGEVARMLGLAGDTEATLRHIFEAWDGSGFPSHMHGNAVPAAVFVVSLAGDLEIFSRTYGLARALDLIANRSDRNYPARLAELVPEHAAQWLSAIEQMQPGEMDAALLTPRMQLAASPELIADVIDLKLPWMTGYSRAVAGTAVACCNRLALGPQVQARLHVAGLIHGIGRAAVPNSLWSASGRLSASAWEKVRLVPYWTWRAGKQIGALEHAAELASYAYERLDGTGYFRGVGTEAIALEARILAASGAWAALRSPRPWRDAFSQEAAAELLHREAGQGRFDVDVVDALIASEASSQPMRRSRPQETRLSARELDVLRLISQGASNKEVARDLAISPSTVRTHVESVFRKLECSTRAAATLKAVSLGVL